MNRFDPLIIFPIFVAIIVIVGLFYTNFSRNRFLNQAIAQSSPSSIAEPVIATASPSPLSLLNDSISPSMINLQDLQYPASEITTATDTNLLLVSTDSPNKITNWYKDKIKRLNMNITTSAMSSANQNVLNTMIASQNSQTLTVEIKKNQTGQQQQTTINISVK